LVLTCRLDARSWKDSLQAATITKVRAMTAASAPADMARDVVVSHARPHAPGAANALGHGLTPIASCGHGDGRLRKVRYCLAPPCGLLLAVYALLLPWMLLRRKAWERRVSDWTGGELMVMALGLASAMVVVYGWLRVAWLQLALGLRVWLAQHRRQTSVASPLVLAGTSIRTLLTLPGRNQSYSHSHRVGMGRRVTPAERRYLPEASSAHRQTTPPPCTQRSHRLQMATVAGITSELLISHHVLHPRQPSLPSTVELEEVRRNADRNTDAGGGAMGASGPRHVGRLAWVDAAA